jgi:hypothetical protein
MYNTQAVEKALKFHKFWMTLDGSGDRFVNVEELEKIMPRDGTIHSHCTTDNY